MMAKNTAERVQALRQRRQELGLVRVELWAHESDAERLKKYAARLQKLRQRDGQK